MTSSEHVTPGLCPFCGSDQLLNGSWYIDEGEVDAWECSKCFAGAPQAVWNTRHSPTLESTPDWHYPAHNLDMENMPQPGEIVVVYYRDDRGIERGPTIMTPIHADGHHTIAGLSIYQPIVRWCAIPAE